jgi:uncharacterized protein YgbK (DUF1537 family)
VLVLADDATGALEMGAMLAPCTVSLSIPISDGVVDTESRHLGPGQARECIRSILRRVPRDTQVFKKIDSTLRGSIGAELEALVEAFPDRRLIVCPAYPRFGRTVREGVLLVDGTPVSQSRFGDDPRSPVTHSWIPWGDVHDAETDEDLARIAALCDESCIAVGSGGLARFVLGTPVAAAVPPVQDWLVVCGSLHPISLRQAETARSHGIAVVSGVDAAALAVARRPQGFIIFGGETAFATFRHLGVRSVTTLGEVLPGVPLSLAGDIPVITKAGGFGAEDLVPAILRKA